MATGRSHVLTSNLREQLVKRKALFMGHWSRKITRRDMGGLLLFLPITFAEFPSFTMQRDKYKDRSKNPAYFPAETKFYFLSVWLFLSPLSLLSFPPEAVFLKWFSYIAVIFSFSHFRFTSLLFLLRLDIFLFTWVSIIVILLIFPVGIIIPLTFSFFT